MKKGCWKRVICLRQKVCALCVTVEQQYLFLLSYTVDTRLRKSRETYFGTRPPFPSHHYLLSRAALLLRLYTTYYILLTSMWQKWNDCELNATFYAILCSRSIISTVIYGHPICNIYCMLQTLGEQPHCCWTIIVPKAKKYTECRKKYMKSWQKFSHTNKTFSFGSIRVPFHSFTHRRYLPRKSSPLAQGVLGSLFKVPMLCTQTTVLNGLKST